jgi:hypothetical protein
MMDGNDNDDGELMWNATSAHSTTKSTYMKTILLESSIVNNNTNKYIRNKNEKAFSLSSTSARYNHVIDATTVSDLPSDETSQLNMLWPALRASKKLSRKKVSDFYPTPSAVNNMKTAAADNSNNIDMIKDEGLTVVSSSRTYREGQAQDQSIVATTLYHRTPTPPRATGFSDRKQYALRKSRILKEEAPAAGFSGNKNSNNKPIDPRKPYIRQRINNRNQLRDQYTFINGVPRRIGMKQIERPVSPLQGWNDLDLECSLNIASKEVRDDMTSSNSNDNNTEVLRTFSEPRSKKHVSETLVEPTPRKQHKTNGMPHWWNTRNIWSENNEIEIYNPNNDYNYITLTTRKANQNRINRLHMEALNFRLRKHHRIRQKRRYKKYFKSKSKKEHKLNYKKSSPNSKFYVKSSKEVASSECMNSNGSCDDKTIPTKQRQLKIREKQKQRQMEQARLELIQQLRQARHDKRDSMLEKSNDLRQKNMHKRYHSLKSVKEFDFEDGDENRDTVPTRIHSPTNADLYAYTLERKQFKRNSPKESSITDANLPLPVESNEDATGKKTGKLSTMDRLFVEQGKISSSKLAEKAHIVDIAKDASNHSISSEEYYIDGVESLTFHRI